MPLFHAFLWWFVLFLLNSPPHLVPVPMNVGVCVSWLHPLLISVPVNAGVCVMACMCKSSPSTLIKTESEAWRMAQRLSVQDPLLFTSVLSKLEDQLVS